jgi:drug/metabolite transporter (DMT)-like permease
VARDEVAGLAPAATRLVHDPVRGIAIICLAMALFSGLDTTAKYLVSVTGLPTVQVVWMRFIGQFGAIVLAFGLFAIPRLLTSDRKGLLLVRSGLLLASTICNFFAMRELRLDQVVTVSFLTPLAVALMSGPLLGEWIGWRRLVAVLVGFCGILIAVRPGYTTFEPAFLFAFGTVIAYALFQLATRVLAATEPPEVILFYSMFAGVVLMAPFALTAWVWPADALTWALLVSMGLWAAIGHGIFIVAYRYADTNTLAPFAYISLLTHTLGGWVVFGQVPDVWTLAGAVVIIASGLYVLWREQVRAREARRA